MKYVLRIPLTSCNESVQIKFISSTGSVVGCNLGLLSMELSMHEICNNINRDSINYLRVRFKILKHCSSNTNVFCFFRWATHSCFFMYNSPYVFHIPNVSFNWTPNRWKLCAIFSFWAPYIIIFYLSQQHWRCSKSCITYSVCVRTISTTFILQQNPSLIYKPIK